MMLSRRALIVVAAYEVIFSPLLLWVTPRPAFLRWVLAVGFALGVVGLGTAAWWWWDERR